MDAPASVVWALVTDINLPARFSSEFLGAEWEDELGLRVDARFIGRSRHDALGSWETTCTVIELEPQRSFAYAVGDPRFPSAVWRYSLAPLSADKTRLTQSMQIGPGRSGLSLAIDGRPDKERRIVSRRLLEHQANMQRTCAGIAELAAGVARVAARPPDG